MFSIKKSNFSVLSRKIKQYLLWNKKKQEEFVKYATQSVTRIMQNPFQCYYNKQNVLMEIFSLGEYQTFFIFPNKIRILKYSVNAVFGIGN